MNLRTFAERCSRNLQFRRRLPGAYGGHVIWTSPDARLRYLRPGVAAFDQELLQTARNFVRPGQIVIDVGANVGEFAVAACHFAGPKGAVLAIEPDPFLCALLHRTIAEPGNSELPLDALCAAIADKEQLVPFLIASRGRASNALAGYGLATMGAVRGRFIAPVLTIDAVAKQWRAPDFIKIDVEGAELLALQGAGQTLAQHRPLIFVEVTTQHDSVYKLFRSASYKLFAPALSGEVAEISRCEFNTLAVPEEKIAILKSGGGMR